MSLSHQASKLLAEEQAGLLEQEGALWAEGKMAAVCGRFFDLYLLCLFVRFCYSYFIPSSVTGGVTSYIQVQGVTCYRRNASECLEDREGKQKARLNRDAKKHAEVLSKRLPKENLTHDHPLASYFFTC